jgi:peroxiredoxin
MATARGYIVGVFAITLASCATAPPPPSQPSPLLSRVLPSFAAQTLGATPFDTGQGAGHAMIVKFFSADCARCKSTLPAVQRIYSDNPDIVVIGVSEDESAARARRLVDDLGVHFPVILDANGEVKRKYAVAQMPMTFVVAPNGSVRWVGGPEQTEDAVRAALSAARD